MGCASSKDNINTAAPVAAAPPASSNKSSNNNAATTTTTSVKSQEKKESSRTPNDAVVSPATSGSKRISISARTNANHSTEELVQCDEELIVGDLTVRIACASQRGRDPDNATKPNQDCYSVLHSIDTTSRSFGLLAAVYDGHGPTGEQCSAMAQRTVPELYQQRLDQLLDITPNIDQVEEALKKAHVDCDEQLRTCDIDDSNSGTTAISVYIYPNERRITVSNVGDSRAILGTSAATSAGNTWMAVPLSTDQTPKRQDEARRCMNRGARILSFGQINPSTYEEGVEDPPRVWAGDGNYPGTAFTRSVGDAIAAKLGVIAEPEFLTLKLSDTEKVIVLASDGIFDVLTNQQVIDVCHKYRRYPDGPKMTCQALLKLSHAEWLLNDDCGTAAGHSYDDMTVCCLFLGPPETAGAAHASDNASVEIPKRRNKRVRQKTLKSWEEMEGTAPDQPNGQ